MATLFGYRRSRVIKITRCANQSCSQWVASRDPESQQLETRYPEFFYLDPHHPEGARDQELSFCRVSRTSVVDPQELIIITG